MRITTNAILRNYRSNLNKSNNYLNSAREKVLSKRKFNKVSEDPASATLAFQLRRNYLKNDDYLENLKTVQSQLDTVESSAMQISNIAKEADALILQGVNGSSSIEQRKTIATSLRKMQESAVLSINSKYGDKFLFGGSNTKDVPFTLDSDVLKYHGLDVNDPANDAIFNNHSNQKLFVDIGFGLQEDAGGNLIESSAFNTAFPGVKILGHGKNADGIDKNVVNLLGEIADALEQPELDEDHFKKLTDQFTQSRNNLVDFVTKLGTDSKFLENTEERLKDTKITLNEKLVSVENVDLSEAITNYSWAHFAYNAALKVGNSILSQSFIDFMR